MSEQDLEHIISSLSKRMFRNVVVSVISAVILSSTAILVSDHYMLEQKLDKTIYEKNYGNLMLLIEGKTRAIESLANGNTKDIVFVYQQIEEIKEYQKEIDKYLRENFRERGLTQLPEY